MVTYRSTILTNEQFYHVFNRGIERRAIFSNKREFDRALNTLKYYRYANVPFKFSKFLVQTEENKTNLLKSFNIKENELVEIIAYCLMPNHFHLLLKQIKDNGISKFISNLTNSYTKYFNTKHERVGALMQGIFKAVRVETDEQLIHLSRYIHLNPVSSFVIKEQDLNNYPWFSYREYLGLEKDEFCAKEYVLNNFKTKEDYQKFVLDQLSYAQELERIKHLLVEN